MDAYVRHFIRSSLVWLAIGVVLGIVISLWPQLLVYRPAHMHANLLGFVSMMIFGVAYHVLPRFVGQPLHRPRLAAVHVWLANIGLALLVGGWMVRPHHVSGLWLVPVGGIVAGAGAFAFAFNIWRTLDAAAARAGMPVMPMRRGP